MRPKLSVIIPVGNAPVSELMMPLASLNNQLGIARDAFEVLLIDNGEFHVEQAAALSLFSQLTLRLMPTPTIVGRMGAIAAGVAQVTGEYVLILDANNQLYQPFTLQGLFTLQRQHPDADLIGGTTMLQALGGNRQPVYQAGKNLARLQGLMIRRGLLASPQVCLSDDFDALGEELAARTMRQAAGGIVETDELVCVTFSTRTHAVHAADQAISPAWVTMMARYLEELRQHNASHFDPEFAKFVVRFFSQAQHVAPAAQPALTATLVAIVKQYAATWPAVAHFVAQQIATDKTPAAPWNAAPKQFDRYLRQLAGVASQAVMSRH